VEVLFVLIPLSVLLAAAFVAACVAAIRGGQYDDMESPRWRMLFDAPSARRKAAEPAGPDEAASVVNDVNEGKGRTVGGEDVNESASARRRTPT